MSQIYMITADELIEAGQDHRDAEYEKCGCFENAVIELTNSRELNNPLVFMFSADSEEQLQSSKDWCVAKRSVLFKSALFGPSPADLFMAGFDMPEALERSTAASDGEYFDDPELMAFFGAKATALIRRDDLSEIFGSFGDGAVLYVQRTEEAV